MNRCRHEKIYAVVNSEEKFIFLMEKYLVERGFVLVNTCPLSSKMDSVEIQRNSEKYRSKMTKSLRRRIGP